MLTRIAKNKTMLSDSDPSTKDANGYLVVSTTEQVETSQLPTANVITPCHEPQGCTENILEQVDSCVGCVNQVGLQQEFEATMREIDLPTSSLLETTEDALGSLQLAETVPDMGFLCGTAALTTTEKTPENASTAEALIDCGVCLGPDARKLPCCGGKACRDCIISLTLPHSDCRAGRCPFCLSWITANAKLETSVVEPVADTRCDQCKNIKPYMLVQNNRTICDACFLGQCYPLRYDCQNCASTQCIRYPLYRHQSNHDAFGTMDWPCDICKQSTLWKLSKLEKVPFGDAPWSDEALQEAREYVLERKSRPPTADECSIM